MDSEFIELLYIFFAQYKVYWIHSCFNFHSMNLMHTELLFNFLPAINFLLSLTSLHCWYLDHIVQVITFVVYPGASVHVTSWNVFFCVFQLPLHNYIDISISRQTINNKHNNTLKVCCTLEYNWKSLLWIVY